jgi:hypothetical protein
MLAKQVYGIYADILARIRALEQGFQLLFPRVGGVMDQFLDGLHDGSIFVHKKSPFLYYVSLPLVTGLYTPV